MELLKPTVVTDGGPWARHNMPCSVCGERHAILHLNTGVFEPCGECTRAGWKTVQKKRWWKK